MTRLPSAQGGVCPTPMLLLLLVAGSRIDRSIDSHSPLSHLPGLKPAPTRVHCAARLATRVPPGSGSAASTTPRRSCSAQGLGFPPATGDHIPNGPRHYFGSSNPTCQVPTPLSPSSRPSQDAHQIHSYYSRAGGDAPGAPWTRVASDLHLLRPLDAMPVNPIPAFGSPPPLSPPQLAGSSATRIG